MGWGPLETSAPSVHSSADNPQLWSESSGTIFELLFCVLAGVLICLFPKQLVQLRVVYNASQEQVSAVPDSNQNLCPERVDRPSALDPSLETPASGPAASRPPKIPQIPLFRVLRRQGVIKPSQVLAVPWKIYSAAAIG